MSRAHILSIPFIVASLGCAENSADDGTGASIAADEVASFDWDDGRAKLEQAEPVWFD